MPAFQYVRRRLRGETRHRRFAANANADEHAAANRHAHTADEYSHGDADRAIAVAPTLSTARSEVK
jgi:hypothetical protein